MFIYCWLFTAAFFERATFTHTSVLWSVGRFPKRYQVWDEWASGSTGHGLQGSRNHHFGGRICKCAAWMHRSGGQNCKVSACGKKPKDIKGLGEAMLAFFKCTQSWHELTSWHRTSQSRSQAGGGHPLWHRGGLLKGNVNPGLINP